jgi:hypothetical protein
LRGPEANYQHEHDRRADLATMYDQKISAAGNWWSAHHRCTLDPSELHKDEAVMLLLPTAARVDDTWGVRFKFPTCQVVVPIAEKVHVSIGGETSGRHVRLSLPSPGLSVVYLARPARHALNVRGSSITVES